MRENHKNTIFIIAAALLLCSLLFCGTVAADQAPFPDDGVLESTTYTLTGPVALSANLSVPNGVTCTIDLNGHTLTGTGSGSVITIESGGNLILNDSSPGTGKITGGNTTYGGGVYNKGTFTMNGGCITENQADYDGGGVWVYYGTFTMNGGSITGNNANHYGGGVWVYNGTVTMKNSSSITGNSAASRGGGVYVSDGGVFENEKGTVIHSNIPDNVVYPWGEEPELDEVDFNNGTAVLLNSSVIRSVTVTDTGRISEVKKLQSVHRSGIDQPPVTIDGKQITVISGSFTLGFMGEDWPQRFPPVSARLEGQLPYSSIKDYTGYLCLAWKKDNAENEWGLIQISGGTAGDDGAYRFTTDFTSTENGHYAFVLAISPKPVTTPEELESALTTSEEPFNIILSGSNPIFQLTQECTITQTGTLDLNGKVIKAAPEQRLITVEFTGNLTITDSAPDTKHYFSKDETGLYTYAGETRTEGLIELSGGCLTGGKAETGGGIRLENGGKFTLDGGVIVGNTAVSDGDTDGFGGGVYVVEPGLLGAGRSDEAKFAVFIMNGGTIIGNTAVSGGGVNVETSSFLMKGGSIKENRAETAGGVYVLGSLFTMEGGDITKNQASRGGGVFVCSGGDFDRAGIFSMEGGSITENHAKDIGGGVYMGEENRETDVQVFISGASVVSDNTAGDADNKNNLCLDSRTSLVLDGGGLTGSVGISYADGEQPFAGEVFGTAADDATGAEHFAADVAAGQTPLIGGISGTNLVWKKAVTVTFNVQDRGTTPDPVTVASGSKVTKPADPSDPEQKYTFGGWFTEAECTNRWNFDSDTVIKDMTLYAKWMVNEKEEDAKNDEEHQGTKKAETNYGIPPVTKEYVPATLDSVSRIPDNSGVAKVKCGKFSGDSPQADSTIKQALTVVGIQLFDSSSEPVTALDSPAKITITILHNDIPAGVNESNARIAHKVGEKWEILPGGASFNADGDLVVTGSSSTFSPFAVVQLQPKSSSSGSPTHSSVWLTAEPTPTPAPEVPQVKPVNPSETPAKSPAPVMGVLAGLGAAAAVLAVRMRR